ncbi:MAG: alpha/beta hydrolase [Myxococcota bacterium]|nr:alpha/beta hydrolase [Myxococcota bacterium]
MPSPEHRAIVAAILAQPKPDSPPSVEESRAGMEAMTAGFAVPDDVSVEKVDAGGVPSAWVAAPGARDDVAVLYLHGGGYMMGSVKTHTELASRVSRASAARVLVIDYRLAPENPFPAAVEDAVASYRWLGEQGFARERIVIAGDSAGGGLTLATLAALSEASEPLPAAAVCLSPFADLEGTGQSYQTADDPLITAEAVHGMAAAYLQGQDMRQPTASPLYADYSGFPPLLIQVGTRELLLDDSTRVAQRARDAGVDVTLEEGEGLIHVWQLLGPNVPESVEAVDRIGAFVRKHTS